MLKIYAHIHSQLNGGYMAGCTADQTRKDNACTTDEDNRRQRFKNQIVIVTGASRGIGRGIASLFAEEGAKVVLIGRDEVQLKAVKTAIQADKGEAITIKADVSDPGDIDKMFDEVLEYYGRVDVLCHNAGIYPQARLENMSLEEWQKVIDVNLTGTFLAVRACIPTMKAQGYGKIVITSSISGPQTALPGFSHYTASKGGVAGFIKTAAVELAKYNININAVEPGTIASEGLDATGQERINNMIRAIPLGRLGTPQDVGYATLFLASKESDYITGQSLIVDGGQTLPESHFDAY
jgi:3-oxoacyl-[acyl-carrier protein] reductase